MAGYTPTECLVRAEEERALADAATLENVRERHLRSARRWEDLGSEVRLMIEAKQAETANRTTEPDAARARGGGMGGRKRAENMSADQRSEAARQASLKRWRKLPE